MTLARDLAAFAPSLYGALEHWGAGGGCPIVGSKHQVPWLAPQAVVEKFRDNASRVLGAAAVRGLEDAALALDALPDVGALMTLCRA